MLQEHRHVDVLTCPCNHGMPYWNDDEKSHINKTVMEHEFKQNQKKQENTTYHRLYDEIDNSVGQSYSGSRIHVCKVLSMTHMCMFLRTTIYKMGSGGHFFCKKGPTCSLKIICYNSFLKKKKKVLSCPPLKLKFIINK